MGQAKYICISYISLGIDFFPFFKKERVFFFLLGSPLIPQKNEKGMRKNGIANKIKLKDGSVDIRR